jgi:alpha-tubulin suppressor-like RCC1 family protein
VRWDARASKGVENALADVQRTLPPIVAVEVAGVGECVRANDGNLWRFQNGTWLAMLDQVTLVTAGPGHACARRSDGSLRCWGGNYWGELGIGINDHGDPDHVPQHDPTPVSTLGALVVEVCAGLGNATVALLP